MPTRQRINFPVYAIMRIFFHAARSPMTGHDRCFSLPHKCLRRADRFVSGTARAPGKCSTNHCKPRSCFEMRSISREMRDMRRTALLAHNRIALDNECRRNARMNVVHLSYSRSAHSADDDPARVQAREPRSARPSVRRPSCTQIRSFQHARLLRAFAGVVIWHSPFFILHS